jgi:hypothetical protein
MILALVIKAAIIISVTGKELVTISDEALSLVFFYYFFLEIFPLSVVLLFYKVDMENVDEKGSIDEVDQMESIPLDPANNRIKNKTKKASRSPISNIKMNTSAPSDMVDAIIARLSTGETISDDISRSSDDGTESIISIGSGIDYRNKGLRSNILTSQGNRYRELGGSRLFDQKKFSNSRDSRDGQSPSVSIANNLQSSNSSIDDEYNKILKEKAKKLPDI